MFTKYSQKYELIGGKARGKQTARTGLVWLRIGTGGELL
jgi:hypothetical protein